MRGAETPELILHPVNPKEGITDKDNKCYIIGDTGYLLCIPSCCTVHEDTEEKILEVIVHEPNLLPPNVKQRITNKFYSACKKSHTKPFALLPIRPVP